MSELTAVEVQKCIQCEKVVAEVIDGLCSRCGYLEMTDYER